MRVFGIAVIGVEADAPDLVGLAGFGEGAVAGVQEEVSRNGVLGELGKISSQADDLALKLPRLIKVLHRASEAFLSFRVGRGHDLVQSKGVLEKAGFGGHEVIVATGFAGVFLAFLDGKCIAMALALEGRCGRQRLGKVVSVGYRGGCSCRGG